MGTIELNSLVLETVEYAVREKKVALDISVLVIMWVEIIHTYHTKEITTNKHGIDLLIADTQLSMAIEE